jgi:hypothetical protein
MPPQCGRSGAHAQPILARVVELDEHLRAAFLGVQQDNVRTLRWAEKWLDAKVS